MYLVFSSCLDNELLVNYKESTESTLQLDKKGKLECAACCETEYNFDMSLQREGGNKVKGNLRISYKESYADYHITGTYIDDVLTLNTGKPYKTHSTRCSFCLDNVYVLKKQKDSTFRGVWTKSSCDSSVIESATVITEPIYL